MARATSELLASALVVAFCGWALWEAREWSERARLFPWTIGSAVLLLALLQLGLSAHAAWRADSARAAGKAVDAEAARRARRALRAIAFWIAAYFLGLWLLGFKLGAPLLTAAYLRFSARESLALSAMFAGAVYLVLLAFDQVLGIAFTPGLIAEALGLRSPDSYLIEPIMIRLRGG